MQALIGVHRRFHVRHVRCAELLGREPLRDGRGLVVVEAFNLETLHHSGREGRSRANPDAASANRSLLLGLKCDCIDAFRL